MHISNKILTCFAIFAVLAAFPAGAQTVRTVVGICSASGYYGDGGPASQAGLDCPDDIAFDSHGNYYMADACSNTVRKVNITTGTISTYAGAYNPNGNPIAGDGGPATLAYLNYPAGVAFDRNDNLYITDFYNNVIRKVDATAGLITTFAGTVTVSGGVTQGLAGYSGDGGPATLAKMSNPNGIRLDPTGTYLVTSAAATHTSCSQVSKRANALPCISAGTSR